MIPEGRRKTRVTFLLGAVATVVFAIVSNVVAELASDNLSLFGRWATGIAFVIGVLVLLFLARTQSPHPDPDAKPAEEGDGDEDDGGPGTGEPEPLPLPPRARLHGAGPVIDSVLAKAKEHGVVLVSGPAGTGTSVVAAEAARQLVPDSGRQSYVDLRGATNGWRAALRALGIKAGPLTGREYAGEQVREALQGTRRVMLLDNVTLPELVSWVPERLTGAYLIVAASPGVQSELPRLAQVGVGRMRPEPALALLREQDTGNGITERVDADERVAHRLAETSYMGYPRVVMALGQWLADHPALTLGELLAELEGEHEPQLPALIVARLQEHLDGISPGARHLLELLAQPPVPELTEAGAAALLGEPEPRVAGYLTELTRSWLVRQPVPGRFRVVRHARLHGQQVPRARVAEAHARLIAYYAGRATAQAQALAGPPHQTRREQARQWFEDETATLVALLGMPDPPRRSSRALWEIADAVETWAVWAGRPDRRRAAAEAMAAAAAVLNDPPAAATARLRLAAVDRAGGRIEAAEEHLREVRAEAGRSRWNRPQLHTAWALQHLANGDTAAARDAVLLSRRVRPRRDTTGRVTDAVNLAVVRLHDGEPEAAAGLLDHALALARAEGDLGGEAHARELLGVAVLRTGHTRQALAEWKTARQAYERLADAEGEARCLVHLGAVQLAGGGSDEDREQARELLRRSLDLRAGHAKPDAKPDPEPATRPARPRRPRPRGLGVALAHLHLGEEAERAKRPAAEVRAHRDRGLAALPEPPGGGHRDRADVAALRERLGELGTRRAGRAARTGSPADGPDAGGHGLGIGEWIGRWRRRAGWRF